MPAKKTPQVAPSPAARKPPASSLAPDWSRSLATAFQTAVGDAGVIPESNVDAFVDVVVRISPASHVASVAESLEAFLSALSDEAKVPESFAVRAEFPHSAIADLVRAWPPSAPLSVAHFGPPPRAGSKRKSPPADGAALAALRSEVSSLRSALSSQQGQASAAPSLLTAGNASKFFGHGAKTGEEAFHSLLISRLGSPTRAASPVDLFAATQQASTASKDWRKSAATSGGFAVEPANGFLAPATPPNLSPLEVSGALVALPGLLAKSLEDWWYEAAVNIRLAFSKASNKSLEPCLNLVIGLCAEANRQLAELRGAVDLHVKLHNALDASPRLSATGPLVAKVYNAVTRAAGSHGISTLEVHPFLSKDLTLPFDGTGAFDLPCQPSATIAPSLCDRFSSDSELHSALWQGRADIQRDAHRRDLEDLARAAKASASSGGAGRSSKSAGAKGVKPKAPSNPRSNKISEWIKTEGANGANIVKNACYGYNNLNGCSGTKCALKGLKHICIACGGGHSVYHASKADCNKGYSLGLIP